MNVLDNSMGLLPDTQNCGLRMHRECVECFPRHQGLAIPTCITARAWCTCRDACRDRKLVVSFEVGGGENVPGIPNACVFAYMVTAPFKAITPHDVITWKHITDGLWGESIRHQLIPLTNKPVRLGLGGFFFLISVKQINESSLIWDALTLIWLFYVGMLQNLSESLCNCHQQWWFRFFSVC